MMRVFFLILLFIFGGHATIIMLDTHFSTGNEDVLRTKDLLRDFYLSYFPTSSLQHIKLFSFSSEAHQLTDWINVRDQSAVFKTIASLEFQRGACANWTAAFEILLEETPSTLIFAVDENHCIEDSSNFIVAAENLKKKGWFIFAAGMGPFVSTENLKMIAGPCGLQGCLHGVNYAHVNSFHEKKIHMRSSHISLKGNVLSLETNTPLPGIVLQLSDACDSQLQSVTDQQGDYFFSACNGESSLNLLLPASYVSLNATLQKVSLGNGTLELGPFYLDRGSIGEGPLSAGEIVAISIVGTILFLVFTSCIYQTCNFALFMEKQKMY